MYVFSSTIRINYSFEISSESLVGILNMAQYYQVKSPHYPYMYSESTDCVRGPNLSAMTAESFSSCSRASEIS